VRHSRLEISMAPEMQSPTQGVGLHRVATSLWPHFVALPQRMPADRHRRVSRVVVSFVYKIPPFSWLGHKGRAPRSRAPGNAGFRAIARSIPGIGAAPAFRAGKHG
jgi:hypothetical protein